MKFSFGLLKAKRIAQALSQDAETKVGCVLLDANDNWVNGEANRFVEGATGLPDTRPEKYEYILHAEVNLLLTCAKHGLETKGGVLISTLSPCPNCVRHLWQAGVQEIYFEHIHPSFEETLNMKDLKVELKKIDKYYGMTVELRCLPI